MAKFVVDTNLYIDAIRTDAGNEALANWQRQMAPHLFQHSVIAQEILAGAMDEGGYRAFYEDWVQPFERLGRVVSPTHGAWKRSALILSRLLAGGHKSLGGYDRSFLNDCLIAASARVEGITLVTRNLEDYGTISLVEPGLRYVPPWP